MLPGEPIIERKAHQIEISRARADVEHVLDEDFVGERLLLLDHIVLELAKLTLAEAGHAVFQHPLAVEHGHLAVRAQALDEGGFQIGVGSV